MQAEGKTVSKKSPAASKPVEPPKKFRDMTGRQKVRFVGKVMVFVISFGFIFPTLLVD